MTAAKIPYLFLLCAILLTGCRSGDAVSPEESYQLCESGGTIQLRYGSKVLSDDIESLGIGRYFLIFYSGTEHTFQNYGILIYASGTIHYFRTEQDLLSFARRNYSDCPVPEWQSPRTFTEK